MLPLVALVHSPLVGPATWMPVARRLRARGWRVAVPRLVAITSDARPYWERHASAVAKALQRGATSSVVLVGHSGAGPILPCIAEALDRPVAALVFVDASIPRDGSSRLDLLSEEASPEVSNRLRTFLEGGGAYPDWREREMQNLIPDPRTRWEVMEEVRPYPMPFWAEPIHVPAGWDRTPCAYLRLSNGYAVPAAEAQRRGWPYRELDAGHFHMVVDAEAVASELVELLQSIGACNEPPEAESGPIGG